MKVDIACPTYSGVLGAPEEAIRKAMNHIALTGAVLQVNGLAGPLHIISECGWVDLARAELLSPFMKGTSDAILFHDQDVMPVEPKTILSMIAALEQFREVGVVFCSYKVRTAPHAWIFTRHEERVIRIIPGVHHLMPRVIVRAKSGPLGFALIRRSALEKLVYSHPELESCDDAGKQLFELFLPMVKDHTHLGEDAAFFHRCAATGVRVECLVDAEIDHAGVSGKLSLVL